MIRGSLIGTLSLVLLAGCKPGQPETAEAAPAKTVSVAAAERGRITDTLALSGTVQAAGEVRIVPRLTGRLLEVAVDEGDRVRKGQLLALVETPELEWQLEQQRAALATAEANLARARSDLERMRLLLDEGAISRQQFEGAATQAQVAQAQARQLRAAIGQVETQIGHGRIVSPIEGTVLHRSAEVGAMAAPGAPLLTLARDGRLSVGLQVPEQHVSRLRTGSAVEVRSAAYPGRAFQGRVARVNPAVDPRTRLLPIKVDLASSELRVGMFVEAGIETAAREGVTVPGGAIQSDGAGSWVFLVERNRARRVAVKIGGRSGDRVEVVSGVAAGSRVVADGAAFVEDGDPLAFAR